MKTLSVTLLAFNAQNTELELNIVFSLEKGGNGACATQSVEIISVNGDKNFDLDAVSLTENVAGEPLLNGEENFTQAVWERSENWIEA